MPLTRSAIICTARRLSWMNCGLSSRSLGGYPITQSSGKTTVVAPPDLARSANSMILREFPAMSPTVGLICASAIRMN
jgi:hypothetical protein